ncbi:MAG TPA: winged helix DNA-binding domain-containing protein [Gemmatimonadaceae bacterium]|nr:winged helix DNA-binding domain-containing protein [Gemmatimonadaceae bacterium]
MAAQFLTTKGPASAAELVRAQGAVQAQDYSGAKWALGQRIPRATDESIEREMTSGAILRTHVMRPTWHFVAPEDIRWMLALTAPRVIRVMASYDRKLGLTSKVYARSNDVIAKALEGGKFLTRTELAEHLKRARLGVVKGQRLGHIVARAELDAVICSGPRRGKQFTYALLDERAPATAPRDRDDALREITLRFFRMRGPGSVHDFAWWSGLTIGDARRAVEIAGSSLQHTTFRDRDMWFVDRALPRTTLTAHLLPNYDEYFIGYKDRGATGERLGNVTAITGGNALIAHVVFINGELVGGWKRIETKNRVTVRLRTIPRLSKSERTAIETAAERFSEFLGRPVQTAWAR